ncbi:MAG: hypothetical protein WC310_02305 [Patescibacteria group bacterium]|jgi:hypothetical protein
MENENSLTNNDNLEELTKLKERMRLILKPVTELEIELVEDIALDFWNLRRITKYEQELIDKQGSSLYSMNPNQIKALTEHKKAISKNIEDSEKRLYGLKSMRPRTQEEWRSLFDK